MKWTQTTKTHEQMTERPAYLLRFPTKEMRERLKAEAKAQGRSLNAHIIYLLTHKNNESKG